MRRLLLVSSLLILALVGCKKPEEAFIGKWKVKSGASALAQGAAKQSIEMIEGSTVEMTTDKVFSWKVKFGGMEVPFTGKWALSGDKVVVNLETIQGQPLGTVSQMIVDPKQKKDFDNLTKPFTFSKGDANEIKMQSTIPNAPTYLLEKVN